MILQKIQLQMYNEQMKVDIKNVDKHRNQIQNRINLLQEKFKDKDLPKNHIKKYREYTIDQNKHFQHEIRGVKTMDLKGRIKQQRQNEKQQKDSAFTFYPSSLRQPLSETRTFTRNIKKQEKNSKVDEFKDEKDQKIKQLYDMMKLILDGQKNIEKEINDLKLQNKEQQKKKDLEINASFIRDQTPLDSSIDKVALSKQKSIDRSGKKDAKSVNQSLLIKEEIRPTSKPKKIRKNKNIDIQEHLDELKYKGKDGERVKVGEEWKARIWAQVENRVKQSQKQYKDTIHRNNKHEFEHLISTFDLQRKLKDDLLQKVYDQCNKQFYK